MPLPEKCCSIEAAIARIPDGARVMVGGFGVPGTPFCLLHELRRQGQRELTLIKNDANEVGMGVDWLLESGQVRRLITSHIGLNANAINRMNTGRLEVVLVPQGILAERIRVAGAGGLGFISDIGIGTALTEGRPLLTIDGRQGVVETALSADFALIHAAAADSFGNLRFAASARNFNPIMAMAAEHSIVEAETVLPLGAIPPDEVHLPGPFVADVVALGKLPEVYGVVKR